VNSTVASSVNDPIMANDIRRNRSSKSDSSSTSSNFHRSNDAHAAW